MIEKEYKTMLNYEKYIRLLEVFHFEEALVQVNLYYISKQDDNNTVRVRCKSGRIFLQVKIDCSIEKGIHINREYEKEIEIIPYIITKEELNNLCGVDFFEDRYLLDILVTERRNYICEDNIISLDRNSYLGITDYELEIEYKNKIVEKIKKKLEQEKIYNEKNTRGKFKRSSIFGRDAFTTMRYVTLLNVSEKRDISNDERKVPFKNDDYLASGTSSFRKACKSIIRDNKI